MSKEFDRLVEIMDELREKCPWDKKQTIHTLRQMTIEEVYELGDAIGEENWGAVQEELGDLLLHIVFYSKIAAEKNIFTISDVIASISKKLIKRHPHVYPPEVAPTDIAAVENEEDVKQNWEKLKLKEGKNSVLAGVPVSLPAVVKAMRLQEKAKQVGFEWVTKEDVWKKVLEEMQELQDAIANEPTDAQSEELGDLLFSLVNYARFLKIDAEAALEKTNKKFIKRFTLMEERAKKTGNTLGDMTLDEMDAIWNEIKKQGRQHG